MLGRVVDAAGRPLDGLGPIKAAQEVPLSGEQINPLMRAPIQTVLDTGVRAINGMLTVGRGQRMGLFAGSGVGKSVLLGMMARYTSADVIVVGLIGERGREVKEFIEHILGPEGRARSVVVAAPADCSPLLRMQGAAYSTRLAEYFRDQGKHVLLIMDSLTRYAMAQREIALAIGEPPATKGYPPSVFAKLPTLVERTGNGPEGGGSITAFYTVLTEGDDQQDPIADSARAILDGHIVLSRSLAEAGHYPAIDVEASISRAMTALIPPAQFGSVRRFKQLMSRYQRNRDLISVGATCPATTPSWISRSGSIPGWKPSCSRTSTNAPDTAMRSGSCIAFSTGANMAKPNPLHTLAELAQNDTDAAARELGQLQGLRTQAENQLNQLTQYRQEYRARMQAVATEGMTSGRWHDFSRFLDSLDHAIRQQTNALEKAESDLMAGRSRWQNQKRRVNSFDTLIARADAREEQVAARREQRTNDEYAARLVRDAASRLN